MAIRFGKRPAGAPGALFRLEDRRSAETPGGTVDVFLQALSRNGPVLWLRLLPASAEPSPEGEPGQAVLERRLVTTGRVSREDGNWIQENPFLPLSYRSDEGRTYLRVRVDEERGLGEIPFNLGVARSFYKWIVVGCDELSGPVLEAARGLWPVHAVLLDRSSERKTGEKGPELRLLCDPESQEESWKGRDEHRAPTAERNARALRQWLEARFLSRLPAPWSVRASRKALVPLALFFFLSALFRPWILPKEQRRLHEPDEVPSATLEIEVPNLQEARRAARWALFRFNRRFPSETAILRTLDSALAGAGLAPRDDRWVPLPPAPADSQVSSARLVFSHSSVDPDVGAFSERERTAYEFLAGLVLDSTAYPTDHWWPRADRLHRKHEGVDIGAPAGATVLSPISGRAFVSDGEFGGVSIGVKNSRHALLMAHCDKLLFLPGDSVRAGDGVATIGMTGRTTGPHLHLMTGVVSPSGTGNAGGTRVKWIDPVEWYHLFRAEQEQAKAAKAAPSAP